MPLGAHGLRRAGARQARGRRGRPQAHRTFRSRTGRRARGHAPLPLRRVGLPQQDRARVRARAQARDHRHARRRRRGRREGGSLRPSRQEVPEDAQGRVGRAHVPRELARHQARPRGHQGVQAHRRGRGRALDAAGAVPARAGSQDPRRRGQDHLGRARDGEGADQGPPDRGRRAPLGQGQLGRADRGRAHGRERPVVLPGQHRRGGEARRARARGAGARRGRRGYGPLLRRGHLHAPAGEKSRVRLGGRVLRTGRARPQAQPRARAPRER